MTALSEKERAKRMAALSVALDAGNPDVPQNRAERRRRQALIARSNRRRTRPQKG